MKKLLPACFAGILALAFTSQIISRIGAFDIKKAHKIGQCVVFVLGNSTKDDGSLSPVQRSRTEAGIQAFHAHQCQRMVFSGGAVVNDYVEAKTMADYARMKGIPEQSIVVEGRARNTWENIGCSLPYLQNYHVILLVSEILHTFRAQRYLCRQSEALCPTVALIGSVPPWYLVWKNTQALAHEVGAWLRDSLWYEGGAKHAVSACPTI